MWHTFTRDNKIIIVCNKREGVPILAIMYNGSIQQAAKEFMLIDNVVEQKFQSMVPDPLVKGKETQLKMVVVGIDPTSQNAKSELISYGYDGELNNQYLFFVESTIDNIDIWRYINIKVEEITH